MIPMEVSDGSTEEEGFSFEKDEKTFERLEARESHQHCKVPPVRRVQPCIQSM